MARKEVDLWFSEAKNDFKMGELLLKGKMYNGAAFHFQQAAEKSLKALLYLFNLPPWGHSILKLLRKYKDEGHQINPELESNARELDRHYITSRYPDTLPNITPQDAYDEKIAQSLKEKAQFIIDFVEQEKITKEKADAKKKGSL